MAGPLSIEDILAKQKADKEAAAKVLLLPTIFFCHCKELTVVF
jgi:hypothetical protein